MENQKDIEKVSCREEEHQKCRDGELFCPDCGKFFCKKPKLKVLSYYNLTRVLYYLENIKSGTKDIIWDLLCTSDIILHNDCYIPCAFYPLSDYTDINEQQKDALTLLFEHYPDADKHAWEISW